MSYSDRKLRPQNRRSNSKNSIESSSDAPGSHQSTLESHHEDAIDAMGLFHNEPSHSTTSLVIGHSNDSLYDHRNQDDELLDQKAVKSSKKSSLDNKGMGPLFQKRHLPPPIKKNKLKSPLSDQRNVVNDYGSTKNNLQFSKGLATSQISNSNVYKTENPFEIPIPSYSQNAYNAHSRFNRFKSTSDAIPRAKFSQSLPSTAANSLRESGSDDDNDNSVYASSNPSSRRSSNASSYNDVCLPVVSLDESGKRKLWPDISVLEKFSQEEMEELKRISSTPLSNRSSLTDNGEAVNFEYPIISNVDQGDSITEPLIISTDEEIEPINGKLRPTRISPWNKEQDYYRGTQSRMENQRFTYFREDIPNTIHSPNISGLLQDGAKFHDLFSPTHYVNKPVDTPSDSDKEPSLASNRVNKIHASSALNIPPSNNDLVNVPEKKFVPPFWLDILNPTEDEMKALSKTFGIHPLTTEDIFLGEAREKVELFKDYYFVCFTSFDVAQEHNRQKKAIEKAYADAIEDEMKARNDMTFLDRIINRVRRKSSKSDSASVTSRRSKRSNFSKTNNSMTSKRRKKVQKGRKDELIPLNMYIIVFKDGVITFHFKPTPHPSNVRRRARILRDYLTVTSDWIGYAIIDDITDAFAPLIESIETEVNAIEDTILVMQSGENSDSEDDSDSDSDSETDNDHIWIRMKRRNSNISGDKASLRSTSSRSSTSSSSSADTKIISWKRKGDMLRRIGDCRRRVMSLLRLLGSKADVIKGFSKRCNEQWEVAPRSEIGLYLGDIQDHIVTMVQGLNHYEKLLARSHSNYLAQINIDMTKVNNDMNDILGKITVLGTIVLPLNIVTGLWGMNCIVPGQDVDSLQWFYGICAFMCVFSITSYFYAKRVIGFV